MNNSFALTVVSILALVQSVFGLVRAFGWVQIGMELFDRGLLFLPVVGTVAAFRGAFIAMVALFYLLFAVGAAARWRWTWSIGLTAAVTNVAIALLAVFERGAPGEALLWIVIPAILVVYLLSRPGRAALAF